MSNALFPSAVRGLHIGKMRKPQFQTIIQPSPGNYETRIANTRNPIWSWTLTFEYLKDYDIQTVVPGMVDTDLRTLWGFYLARGGRLDSFLYSDPDDNHVGPALDASGNPNMAAALQLLTDGAGTFYSPLQRNYGQQFFEDITDIDLLQGPLQVYADGLAQVQGVDYALAGPGLAIPGAAWAGMYLRWINVPIAPVTADFYYFFRVRFVQDEAAMERFLNQLWTAGGSLGQRGSASIELVSVKPLPV